LLRSGQRKEEFFPKREEKENSKKRGYLGLKLESNSLLEKRDDKVPGGEGHVVENETTSQL